MSNLRSNTNSDPIRAVSLTFKRILTPTRTCLNDDVASEQGDLALVLLLRRVVVVRQRRRHLHQSKPLPPRHADAANSLDHCLLVVVVRPRVFDAARSHQNTTANLPVGEAMVVRVGA